MLLQAEGDGRCQEPYQLARIRERARLSELEAIRGATHLLFIAVLQLVHDPEQSTVGEVSASRHHKFVYQRSCIHVRFTASCTHLEK